MTNHADPVWIGCQETGCRNGIGVHWRHVDNFQDRFWCPEHDSGAMTLTADEVPC